jgi:hypothetical protein
MATRTRRKAQSGRRGSVATRSAARPDARDRRILELERENRRLRACEQALAELQQRVSQLLGIPLEREAKQG